MGSHKIQQIDLSVEDEEKKDKSKKSKTEQKKSTGKVKKTSPEDKAMENEGQIEGSGEEKTGKPKKKKVRSKRYVDVRGQVDRTKVYSLNEAIELMQKTHFARFVSSVTADLVVRDEKVRVEVSFPHSTGKTKTVAVASEALLKKVDKGEIDFDVLVASPEMMKEIAKRAKVLGPKGLMPNPKDGTVTRDPEKKKKELEGGKTVVKSEKKAPLVHCVVGKTDSSAKELGDNVEALIKAINGKKIKKLVLSSTMSPGIKVDLAPYQAV